MYECCVCVRPFADRHDQQTSDRHLSNHLKQLTQHHNHLLLNSTHSSLNTYSIKHQTITKTINSEPTPAGTKHFQVTCVCVCPYVYDLLRTALIRSNQIKPVRIYTHSNQSRFHQTSHHSQQSFNQEIKKYIAIETTPAGTKHFID